MRVPANLVGKRFERWVVIEPVPRPSAAFKIRWICRCDCGTIRNLVGTALTSGHSKSCGCYKREMRFKDKYTHGYTDHPLFTTWLSMMSRCNKTHDRAYPRYGGRGITVSDSWTDFEKFAADMGPKPTPDHSIDRINNDKGYSKENCRWATRTEQNRNRSNSSVLTFRGRTETLKDWSKYSGIPYETLRQRIFQLHWTADEAILTPVRPLKKSLKTNEQPATSAA